ncbi:hypothetical protein [Modestobacter sp. VKM Ac-2978]|uniref:hypothetical protein n=1 Tax=Modestobacter sp. VKM Ac-2978 TaxID=3004132 RepID=UPI0022AAC833|nr:hypothetical protein [Modestobacter sp. VKM Ac-2978]MCZ2849757.1 hypothetical protein [Modestobacter sp. VKM Ac-2978]
MTASEGSGPQGPHPRRRPAPDPLAMSPAEKLAAEWEARHDVAARGHRGTAGAVQHYLAESRTHEAQRSGVTASGAASAPHDQPVGDRETAVPPSPSRRRWWPFGRRR